MNTASARLPSGFGRIYGTPSHTIVTSSTPTVTHLHGDAGVARLAQRHEIAHVVGTAARKRKLMMYFGCRLQHTAAETVLTQRVCLNISVADAFPRTTVSAVAVWVTQVSVVIMADHFLMFRAILPGRQFCTAGIPARALWTVRHDVPPWV